MLLIILILLYIIFDRMDGVITVCEIKSSDSPFAIDKSYAQELTKKVDIFKKKQEQRNRSL